MKKRFKRVIAICGLLAFSFATAVAKDIHVATTGNDDNSGTEDAPLATIHKAMTIVQPGDRILVHEGTYEITERIKVPELATTPELRCELRAWPEEAAGKVIIDGSNMEPKDKNAFKQARCIYVNHLVNYWTFYGLVLQNAKDNGMKLEGSYNIVERCTFRWNNDTGLQIGMFKDFSIEETQSFPIEGQPEFNPGYTYCRYNKVINCDAYENADMVNFDGSADNGGDADGFACKLFPGPGNEFHGCRAWTNSDDNWDLFMVYHPVVIDHCWAYNAGYYEGKQVGNGNGFKLGGNKSEAIYNSTGAHVVTNCVAFDNPVKGFDQNSASEGIYLINCVAWGNRGGNYQFSSSFTYGGMVVRNSVGWGSAAAFGYRADLANNAFGNEKVDYSGEFRSLSVEDFMAEREADGSLPRNGFARLTENSWLRDKGTPIVDFEPKRFMTASQALDAGHAEFVQAANLTIPYHGIAPDLGAFELELPESLTISIDKEEGLSTFCPRYGLDFSDDTAIAAYKASANGRTVDLTRVYLVAAGEGVLLRSLRGGAVTSSLPVNDEVEKNEGNAFVGALEDTTPGATSADGTMAHYVLYKSADGPIGFYQAGESTKVAAGRAYLSVATSGSTASALNLSFDDDEATAVAAPIGGRQTEDEAVYSLSGLRVTRPGKGMYIVNGRKVVIK